MAGVLKSPRVACQIESRTLNELVGHEREAANLFRAGFVLRCKLQSRCQRNVRFDNHTRFEQFCGKRCVRPISHEQHVDDADIGAGFEQERGKAVAQRVNGNRLAQIRLARGHAAGRLQRSGADRPIPLAAGEQPGTSGSFFGSVALMMRSNASGRPSATPKKKRNAHDTWLMCDHDQPSPAK
jgi:hypothetical protein